MKKKSRIKEDYESMVEKIKNQPGISELMEIYGQYDLVIQQSEAYLKGVDIELNTYTSNTT